VPATWRPNLRRSAVPDFLGHGEADPRAGRDGAVHRPDPQDPRTFERSKLTREGEPAGLRDLTAQLLAARGELPPGDADEIAFDEHAGWLRVRRGEFELVANFARETVHVPLEGALAARICTHHATLEPGYVVLPALSGALLA